jgi:hypothetical protein
MPAAVLESIDSGSSRWGVQESTTLRYNILDAADRDAASAALEAEAPSSLGSLVAESYSVDPTDSPTAWRGSVSYAAASFASKETGESSFQFDTGRFGGWHLMCAIAHVADFGAPDVTAPNHKGAINVVRDAGGVRVEGVTVQAPDEALAFSVVRYQATVDLSALYALKGCAASESVTIASEGVTGTFGQRNLLFLGASGSKRRKGDWEIRYSLCAAPPLAGATIAGITGINKLGMDYIWFELADDVDESAGRLIKTPIAAHTERIFREAALSGLGLPTS